MTPPRFVVLKFGGTSVATAPRWNTIVEQARARIDEGLFPIIVCSAVTKITDALYRSVDDAVSGRDFRSTLQAIVERHETLARELTVDVAAVRPYLDELDRIVTGASLIGERSPRVLARTAAMGELLSTRLGAEHLRVRGIATHFLDARTAMLARTDEARPEAQSILSAEIPDDRDDALIAELTRLHAEGVRAVITQGFIARDATGGTVLLGRGGSDTSASYFAAKLAATRCEIWTDVPGIFTSDPRSIPQAYLVTRASYDEAQEIASMGAKVLHPRSIAPCRRHRIPMEIRWTDHPDSEHTTIGESGQGGAQVKALSSKRGVTLVSLTTSGMWQQVGFLADVFVVFKRHGLSVDLVSTSEMNITVTLDASANAIDDRVLESLTRDLAPLASVAIVRDCAAVSLVGRKIRAILHELGPALSVFEEQRIHLVSQAASDLNLTFVVDEEQAPRLMSELHTLLFESHKLPTDVFGPRWTDLQHPGRTSAPANRPSFWTARREALLSLAERSPVYVLDRATIAGQLSALRGLRSVDRVLYAMKANPHPEVLRLVEAAGFGFECVSLGEVDALFSAIPSLAPERVLFTPNFTARRELEVALERGIRVTIDNAYVLEHWLETFEGREVFLRVDPGSGRGHHKHVHTGGAASKFGIPLTHLPALARKIAGHVKIVGLHAHVGSGILDESAWLDTAKILAPLLELFPDVRVFDLGGGLGVPEKPTQDALDLSKLDATLGELRQKLRVGDEPIGLWLEPGRFIVAQAGALLVRVTQTKDKGRGVYVGVDAGMNALIRPALYGAYHEIVNLSRLEAPLEIDATVVGPICESGDLLGTDRRLPHSYEGDVLLIGTTGAYGRAMSSHYNLRTPPDEVVLD